MKRPNKYWKWCVLTVLGFTVPFYINDSQAQTPDIPITLNMTLSKTDKIWKALRKLPVEEVEELMAEIRQQVVAQTMPKPVEAPKPSPEPEK